MNISGEDTLNDLLPLFYKKYNLDDDGGLNDSKVKIEMTKHFYFYIPNFSSRKKAVLKHDIHHIITEYPSDIKGETEISAWEVASGCNTYWIAWLLNLHGMILGFWINFRGMYRAFIRGRRSSNLYKNNIADEQALKMNVSDLRNLLSIPPHNKKLKPAFKEFLFFIYWLALAAIYSLASIIVLPVIILYNIYLFAKK